MKKQSKDDLYYESCYNQLKDHIVKKIEVVESSRLGSMIVILEWKDKAKEYSFPEKIVINTRLKMEKRLYCLAHEYGHFLQRNSNKKTPLYEINRINKFDEDISVKKNRDKLEIFRFEIGAWDRAFELLKKLKIIHNFESFVKIRNECLMSYQKVLWG